MAILDANSGGLYALNMISLCTNMMQYYVQADGIPEFIVMMEYMQKKAKQAGMPIPNVELVMMALAAVLAAQHFPWEVNNWEGFPAINCTWRAWKIAFCLAQLNCQCQLRHLGGVDCWEVPTLLSLPKLQPSTALWQLLTSWHLWRPMTPWSSSS
jgi:hypothetical protein